MPKATKSTDALPARITAAGLARLFGISVQRLGQLADQGAVGRPCHLAQRTCCLIVTLDE